MNIEEMHVTFRELAQQMGMQTVRAILVEDIDICLNAAITQLTKELVIANIGPIAYNDKVVRQNVSISPINGLRTLYRKANINEGQIKGDGTEVKPYKTFIDSKDIMLYTSFKVSYDNSTLYDCRLIESENIGQTLRDFCNRAAKDAPVCTITGDTTGIELEIITGRKTGNKPKLVQYNYIKQPATVYYDEAKRKHVDCDLPEYLHMDIVQRGVTIYLQSIASVSGKSKKND